MPLDLDHLRTLNLMLSSCNEDRIIDKEIYVQNAYYSVNSHCNSKGNESFELLEQLLRLSTGNEPVVFKGFTNSSDFRKNMTIRLTCNANAQKYWSIIVNDTKLNPNNQTNSPGVFFYTIADLTTAGAFSFFQGASVRTVFPLSNLPDHDALRGGCLFDRAILAIGSHGNRHFLVAYG